MIDLRATARLQLHAGFTLHDALAQVPYYAGLGISHLYLSPIGTAVPGSTHGYDNIDPTVVNPELGGEAALIALSQAAREHGMGLIADIVPNHMATHVDNAWWWDVLRNGRSAKHADWFDIDWRAPGRDGKLWLAVLDRPYATALAEGLITLVVEDDGSAALAHYDQRYPIRPQTLDVPEKAARAQWLRDYNDGAKRGDGRLHKLIERQPYRLNWWRVGNDMLNYRRFFDITSLVALRVELPAVFDAVHALPLRLVAEGHLDGLRIDHVDGLTDPTGYVRKLRSRLDAAGRQRGLKPGTLALYLEKILAPGEALPADWPCDGTTGYDFMDQVGGVLHDAAGFKPLARAWQKVSGRSGDFAQEERAARDEILRGPLQTEFNRAVGALSALARLDPPTREFSPQMLARGLCVLLRWFPVYRTYAGAKGVTGSEAERLRATAARAREACRSRSLRPSMRSSAGCSTMPAPIARRSPCGASCVVAWSSCPHRSMPSRWKTPRSIGTACCCRATRSAAIRPTSPMKRPSSMCRIKSAPNISRVRCWPPPRTTTSAAKTCACGWRCSQSSRVGGSSRARSSIP